MSKIPCLTLMCLSLCGFASAETLQEAWNVALSSNGQIAASGLQQQAAESRANAAKALDWPTLTLSGAAYGLSNAPDASLDTSSLAGRLRGTPFASLVPSSVAAPLSDNRVQVANLMVNYPLYTSGRIAATQGAARAASDYAVANQNKTRQDLKLSIAEAYINVQRAQAAFEVAQQYVSSVAAHQRDVLAMEQQGLAAPVERLTSQVTMSEANARKIEAMEAVDLSRSAYNRLLGRPFNFPVQLAALPDVSAVELAKQDQQAGERALEQRPELAALRAGRTVLNQQALAVKGESGPQVALQAMQVNWNGLSSVQHHTAALGIVFNWTLFDDGLNRKAASALQADAEAIDAQRRDAESLVRLDVRRAELEQVSAQERALVAADTDTLAEEALRLTEKRYSNGLATQTELLAAQTRLSDARRARNNAKFDLQLTHFRLLRAVGEL